MSRLPFRPWPVAMAGAAVVTLGVIGFYVSRLALPLPIFASDEVTYLLRALYPDDVLARYSAVAPINPGVHLSVIRAVHNLGLPDVVGDRIADGAAYVGGLLILWRMGARELPRGHQLVLLLLALAFPYYRFAVSNFAEGLYVGVLGLICLVTQRWWRSRPALQASAAGALMAALVLVKPHGVAVVGAMGALALADALWARDLRRLPLRAALATIGFFAVGNLIQWLAGEATQSPILFFVGGYYGGVVKAPLPPGSLGHGLLSLGAMASAVALLAGPPIVVATADLGRRWRARRDGVALEGVDLVFLLLVLSLLATLAMVAVFAMKASVQPSETKRLWGRYFEFFAPMLWLAAAPALARPISRRTALACGAVVAAGLGGLLLSFRLGVVLFPWDCAALLAFFHPDPARFTPLFRFPYRAVAVLATGLAAVALALRAPPARVGLGLVLVLAVLSVALDHFWVGPIVKMRWTLDRDARAIRPLLPDAGPIVLLTHDANDGHLGYLEFRTRPKVVIGSSGDPPRSDLADAAAVVVVTPMAPPAGSWVRRYQGKEMSLFEKPAG